MNKEQNIHCTDGLPLEKCDGLLPFVLLLEAFKSVGGNRFGLGTESVGTRLVTVGAEVRVTGAEGEDMSWPRKT